MDLSKQIEITKSLASQNLTNQEVIHLGASLLHHACVGARQMDADDFFVSMELKTNNGRKILLLLEPEKAGQA